MASVERLRDWPEIAGQGWGSLLLGNGFSMNISSGFGYRRLFDGAELSETAKRLFDLYDTTNFELVLERMLDAQQISAAFGFPESGLKRMAAEHDGIREALFAAVNDTHVRHGALSQEVLQAVAGHLRSYSRVFTTNYDLIPYWAIMSRRAEFRDMMMPSDGELLFDPATALWSGDRTQLLYLHGALHLWRDDWAGVTGKWTATVTGLLDLKDRYEEHPSREPLLVSEGTAKDKYAVIQRSRYLWFALQELTRDTAPLVIVGSSFGENDTHIVEAIKAGGAPRSIAIGIHVGRATPVQIASRLGVLRERFEGNNVVFFDVATHPLGDPQLNVA